MISYERAKEIAENFLNEMNPDMWNGEGLLPPNVDTKIKSYDIDSQKGNRLDISIFLDPDIGWCHCCEIVDVATNEVIIPLTGYGIDSVDNLVYTILDICMDEKCRSEDIWKNINITIP